MKLNKVNLYKPTSRWISWDAATNLAIANDMLRFMRANNGIGLAANQVGMSKCLFVMEVDGIVRFCFNPRIDAVGSEIVTMEEGCLSFPNGRVEVSRPASVTVSYLSPEGEMIADTLEGMEARCFQHEYDHLEGITMMKRCLGG